jgi:phage terminase large subunit-like protein
MWSARRTDAAIFTTKSRPDQKIDAAVALMMAVGRAMVEDQEQVGLNGFLEARMRRALAPGYFSVAPGKWGHAAYSREHPDEID